MNTRCCYGLPTSVGTSVAVGHVIETMVNEDKVYIDLQSAEPQQQTRGCINTHREFGFNDVIGFH